MLSSLTAADYFSIVAFAGSTSTPNKFATSLRQVRERGGPRRGYPCVVGVALTGGCGCSWLCACG